MKHVASIVTLTALCAGSASAQFDLLAQQQEAGVRHQKLMHTEQLPPTEVRRYVDGSVDMLESSSTWSYMCGSDETGRTVDDLIQGAQGHAAMVSRGDPIVVDSGLRGGGLNLVFNLSGNVPANAPGALAIAEDFLENFFVLDNVTVTVNMSFQNLGGGVLGQTQRLALFDSWNDSRNGLINTMDADDTLQSLLPAGSLPVRYNGASTAVTNEGRVEWTRANFKAAIGNLSLLDSSMTFNTNFSWDWDPSNGVPGSQFSFVDVVIHEVGHALGFVSRVDFGGGNSDISSLDIFRFQRTDGSGDYNPDTLAEFTTTPRTVSFNSPNDDANSDLIDAEYRMSDGNPSQASHFREGGLNIGLMDPSLAPGQTFFGRDYWSDADANMFDAIGWGVTEECVAAINQQPQGDSLCVGETFETSVDAIGPNLTYTWFGPSGLLVGETDATLTITNVDQSDAGNYLCVVGSDCGSLNSENATLTVDSGATITDQPDSQTVDEGDTAVFTVLANGTGLTYTWFGPNGFIAEFTNTLTINNVTPADAGNYTVTVSDTCGFVNSDIATLTVNATGDCPADVNGDGNADPADFTAWLGCFNNPASAPFCDRADVNNSGAIDPSDFTAWLAAFQAGCP